jgi:prepilin-type N-terminal cleavage/methylation domain-containing protein
VQQRSAKDTGFTLIELLVAIVVLGVVTAALGGAMIGFTRNTDLTIDRLGESHDAQISAAYFAQDVSSIGVRTADEGLEQSVETRAGSPALQCGSADGRLVVRLGWDDPVSTTGSVQVVVSYVVEVTAGQRQLHRLVCTAREGSISDTTVAHHLAPTLPVVRCTNDRSEPTSCFGSGSAVPQAVSMVLYLKSADDPGPVYSVTLTGSRRQTTPHAPGSAA